MGDSWMRRPIFGLIILMLLSGCLSNLTDFKSPGELTVRLREEEDLVAELETVIEPKDQKIEELSKELEEKKSEINSLTGNNTELKTSLSTLESEFSQEQLSNAMFIGAVKDFVRLSEDLASKLATLKEIFNEWLYFSDINEQEPYATNYTIDLLPLARKYITTSESGLETLDEYVAYANKSDNRVTIEAVGVNVTQELSTLAGERELIIKSAEMFQAYIDLKTFQPVLNETASNTTTTNTTEQ